MIEQSILKMIYKKTKKIPGKSISLGSLKSNFSKEEGEKFWEVCRMLVSKNYIIKTEGDYVKLSEIGFEFCEKQNSKKEKKQNVKIKISDSRNINLVQGENNFVGTGVNGTLDSYSKEKIVLQFLKEHIDELRLEKNDRRKYDSGKIYKRIY